MGRNVGQSPNYRQIHKTQEPQHHKVDIQCIEKLIELDTQLNEEFKLMRKNIHNFKNKKCWAKIKKTNIRKISK